MEQSEIHCSSKLHKGTLTRVRPNWKPIATTKDGVAMGFQLGLTLANVPLCNLEEQWISDCSIDYKPISFSMENTKTFSNLF